MVVTLTSKAITKTIPPILKMKNVDWEKFNNEIETKIINITIQDKLKKEEIDNTLKIWYDITEDTIKNNIPLTNQIIQQKPIASPYLRFIQHHYSLLQLQADITGWNLTTYNHHRLLKTILKEETDKIKNDNWEETIKHTAQKYKNPKEFWKEIKRLKGNKITSSPHLKINNRLVTSDEEKEMAHREIWKNIFKITDEENQNYDLNKEN